MSCPVLDFDLSRQAGADSFHCPCFVPLLDAIKKAKSGDPVRISLGEASVSKRRNRKPRFLTKDLTFSEEF